MRLGGHRGALHGQRCTPQQQYLAAPCTWTNTFLSIPKSWVPTAILTQLLGSISQTSHFSRGCCFSVKLAQIFRAFCYKVAAWKEADVWAQGMDSMSDHKALQGSELVTSKGVAESQWSRHCSGSWASSFLPSYPILPAATQELKHGQVELLHRSARPR